MYRQSEKKLLSSNISSTCPDGEFGPLTAETGSGVWGTHSNFSGFCMRLGSITARHSSSGRQPKFAVLNTGLHLYSAGWPSHWPSAHILVSKVADLNTSINFISVGFCFLRTSHIVRCLWTNVPETDLNLELAICTISCTNTYTTLYHTTPQLFYCPFSGNTRVSQCQNRTSGLYGARED